MDDRALVQLEEERVANVRPGENAQFGLEDDRSIVGARLLPFHAEGDPGQQPEPQQQG